MKKQLLIKTTPFIFLFFFAFNTTSFAQNFCCCNPGTAATCFQNTLFPGNNCDFWCGTIIGTGNAGTAGGYSAGCAGSACAALPVETTFFKGQIVGNNLVELTWQTALEINNEGFEIQRANNDFRWEFIGFEYGHGNTTEINDYTYSDKEPYPGMNYYRFKQIDYDGHSEFSDIVAVDIKNATGNVRIFPTLATDKLMVDYLETPTTTPLIKIHDLMGRKIMEMREENGAIDITMLEAGQYIITFSIDDQIITDRFIKID